MNDIVSKKRREFVLTILIGISTMVLLCTIFGITDYFRAVNGKRPLFIYRTINVPSFDVSMIGFENTTLTNKEGAEYYGMGYMVSTCDYETENYVFQLGHKNKKQCSTSLTCTKTIAENDKQSFNYSFFDDKLYRIDITSLVPVEKIVSDEVYEEEFIKINDTPSCGATFKRIDETTYQTIQVCNIATMSSSEVEKVYSTNKESLEQTKAKIIDSHSHDKDMKCK